MIAALLAGVVLFNSVSGTPPASCDGTDVKTWWRLESQTLTTGDYIPAGANPSVTLTGMSVSTDAAAVVMGSNGLVGATQAPPVTIGVIQTAEFAVTNSDYVNACTGRVGFWFKYATGSWNTLGGMYLWRLDSPNNDRLDIRAEAGGGNVGRIDMVYRAYNSSVVTSVWDVLKTPMAADTYYYVEGVWDCSQVGATDILKVFINGVLVSSRTDTALTTWLGTPNKMKLGNNNTYRWLGPIYFDQLIVSGTTTKNLYDCRNTASYP